MPPDELPIGVVYMVNSMLPRVDTFDTPYFNACHLDID